MDVGGVASEVMQEEHYYPFGLGHEGPFYATQPTANQYQYNGKELNEEFGLNWNDYGARFYDPAVARWTAIDPLAEKYLSITPYAYVANIPIIYIDPDGRLLILGSDLDRAREDIKSLVNEKYHDRISIDSETNQVSFNQEGISDSDFGNDSGLALLKGLTGADETIQYSVSEEVSMTRRHDGSKYTINFKDDDAFGVENLSKTPRLEDTPSVTTDNSANDGEVTISPSKKFYEYDSNRNKVEKDRASIVFHELQENYERTVNKLPYGYKDRSRKGAHQIAIDKEKKFHRKSNNPGNIIIKR